MYVLLFERIELNDERNERLRKRDRDKENPTK